MGDDGSQGAGLPAAVREEPVDSPTQERVAQARPVATFKGAAGPRLVNAVVRHGFFRKEGKVELAKRIRVSPGICDPEPADFRNVKEGPTRTTSLAAVPQACGARRIGDWGFRPVDGLASLRRGEFPGLINREPLFSDFRQMCFEGHPPDLGQRRKALSIVGNNANAQRPDRYASRLGDASKRAGALLAQSGTEFIVFVQMALRHRRGNSDDALSLAVRSTTRTCRRGLMWAQRGVAPQARGRAVWHDRFHTPVPPGFPGGNRFSAASTAASTKL